MTESRHVTIKVLYEPRLCYGRTLAWIAPELSGAGFTLTEDHLDDPTPSRTWAGYVDAWTYERFACAWRLPAEARRRGARRSDRLSDTHRPSDTHTYVHTMDGMNWEVSGESPIIAVSVRVRLSRRDDRLGLIPSGTTG